jgi:hypothetical protein
MKRPVFASFLLALTLVATPLAAFDATPAKPRIGIVRAPGTFRFERGAYIQDAVRNALRDELRRHGYDAFTAESTLEQMSRFEDRSADILIEIVGESDVDDYGGIGVGGRHADVSLGVLVSRVAADVNIYDGRTLELIATDSLTKRSTAVVPTSIGIGDRHLFAVIALPFIERAQVRSVARAAAREMATRVTEVVRGE